LDKFDIGILNVEFVVVPEVPVSNNYTPTFTFLNALHPTRQLIYSYRRELTNRIAESESVYIRIVVDTSYSASIQHFPVRETNAGNAELIWSGHRILSIRSRNYTYKVGEWCRCRTLNLKLRTCCTSYSNNLSFLRIV